MILNIFNKIVNYIYLKSKGVEMKFPDIFKGNRYEKMEGYCIIVLIIGALMLSAGIGLSAINTKGISAIMAMLGSVISFLATVALILVWLFKELQGE